MIRELGIYSGTERVGDLCFTIRKGSWDGQTEATELKESVHLRISFRSEKFTLSSEQIAWVDGDLGLLGGEGTVDFGAGKWETKTVRTGDGRYELVQSTLGREKREPITVPEEALASEVLPLYLHRHSGEKGNKKELKVFNMTLGQELPFTSTYQGVTPVGRKFTVTYWGMEERIWLDADGMVVREEMALGVLARAPRKHEIIGHLALEKVLTQTAVPAWRLPADLGQRQQVLLALEGSVRTPPDGKWQKVKIDGERVLVRLIRPVIPTPDKRNPDSGMMPADDFALDLESSRITGLAMEITEKLTDPWEKALAVGRWAHNNLGKSMRECFSALQVLEAGEGECQSHSLLVIALCRALEIPARFAYGVVYMPDQDSFLFHTWVEVHVGEWVPIDPTLGNFPAGVDHLTLAVGSYRDQFRIFPFIMGKGGWRISLVDSP